MERKYCSIERARINALLEKSCKNPIVFVVAGTGCGKTSAVTSFLNYENKKPVVWINLTQKDNSPHHFWKTIIEAVHTRDPVTANILQRIEFPQSGELTGELITKCCSVFEEIARSGKQFTVVMDNFHHISAECIFKLIDKRINSFLAANDPKETLILISRVEPPLNIMCLLSKGLLSRITAGDLCFNAEETINYFKCRGINLHNDEALRLCAKTEGWILALKLIADEMEVGRVKNIPDIKSMFDPLFNSIPALYRRFLIAISVFEEWPVEVLEKVIDAVPYKLPPLVQNVRCVHDVNHIQYMNDLSAVYYYDLYRHSFKIHRLFLDYLRERQHEIPRTEIKTTCAIIASWCMENDMLIDAAVNYGKAEDYDGLLKAVYDSPWNMPLKTGAAFLEIIDNVIQGTMFCENKTDQTQALLFLQHVTRPSLLFKLGRFEEAKKLLETSIAEFEALPDGKTKSWILSACYNTLGILGIYHYQQYKDGKHIVKCFERAKYHYEQNPNVTVNLISMTSIGWYANKIGLIPKVSELEQFVDAIVQSVPYAAFSMCGYLSGADSLCKAELAFFQGDLNSAEQYAREAIFKARENRQYEIEHKSLFYLLRINLYIGNTAAGLQAWTHMKALLDKPDFPNRFTLFDISSGWMYAHLGAADCVASWLSNKHEENTYSIHNVYEALVKAKALFTQNRFYEALELLDRDDVRNSLGTFYFGMLEITVLKTILYKRIGDKASALKMFESAYEMALIPSGDGTKNTMRFDMPFIEMGKDMSILAGSTLTKNVWQSKRAWLKAIHTKASVYEKKLSITQDQWSRDKGKGSAPFLMGQELAVLSGISKGLTREEIACDVDFSVTTVKNIIKNVYTKLGAINRADAIRIAASLDLLK